MKASGTPYCVCSQAPIIPAFTTPIGADTMSKLKAAFEAAVADSKTLAQRPDNQTLLKIYGAVQAGQRGRRRRQASRLYRPGRPRQVRCLGSPAGHLVRGGDAGLRRSDYELRLNRQPVLGSGEALVEVVVDFTLESAPRTVATEIPDGCGSSPRPCPASVAVHTHALEMQDTVLVPFVLQVEFLFQVGGHQFGGSSRLFRARGGASW